MTAKEALIKSISKYNWSAANPCKPLPEEYEDCALCEYSDESSVDEDPNCEFCPMLNYWPSYSGSIRKCTTQMNDKDEQSVWENWDDTDVSFKHTHQKITSYDVTFFALILVEAFHDRLQELYRRT